MELSRREHLEQGKFAMKNPFDLTGKVAIVTGGSQGIGEGIVLGLAQAGADVVIAARTGQSVAEVAAAICKTGRRGIGVPTDVTSEAGVGRLVAETVRQLGRVDILVNNAGASQAPSFRRTAVVDLRPDEFDACIALNLKSVYYTCRAAVPVMRQHGGGSIINIASAAARENEPPRAGFGMYSAAKAGVIALTRTMAPELAPLIRINCILPGPVNNPRTRMRSPELLEILQRSIALGRPGEPEDVAGAVVYFASDASAWTTGAALDIDGGLRSPEDTAKR